MRSEFLAHLGVKREAPATTDQEKECRNSPQQREFIAAFEIKETIWHVETEHQNAHFDEHEQSRQPRKQAERYDPQPDRRSPAHDPRVDGKASAMTGVRQTLTPSTLGGPNEMFGMVPLGNPHGHQA